MGLIYKQPATGNQPGGMDNVLTYDGYAVTPSDTLATYQAQVPNFNGQPRVANAIVCTGAGNIALVLDAAGATALLTVDANDVYPIDFTQVKATSTTATGITALFAPM